MQSSSFSPRPELSKISHPVPALAEVAAVDLGGDLAPWCPVASLCGVGIISFDQAMNRQNLHMSSSHVLPHVSPLPKKHPFVGRCGGARLCLSCHGKPCCFFQRSSLDGKTNWRSNDGNKSKFRIDWMLGQHAFFLSEDDIFLNRRKAFQHQL